jgi:stage II sporulation protein AA (anti-sigma F factor antagonist)
MTALAVSIEKSDDGGGPCTVIRLDGEADVTNAPGLSQALSAEAARRPRLLVIDLSALGFMDSSALSAVITAHRAITAAGGVLALASPTPVVARVLALTGTDTIIPVHPTLDDAIARTPRHPGPWAAPAPPPAP